MKSDYVRYKGYDDLFDREMYRGVAGELIRRMFKALDDISDITGQKELDSVMLNFANTAPFLKHEGFQEEEANSCRARGARKNRAGRNTACEGNKVSVEGRFNSPIY
jgi:hypothetical protein